MAKVRFSADRPYKNKDDRQIKGMMRRAREELRGRLQQIEQLKAEARHRGLTID